VLGHDFNFKSMAEQGDDRLATSPIAELEWNELSCLKFKDGSTPGRLDTVLEDLQGSETRLVIELKGSSAAAQLAAQMVNLGSLKQSVAWVMSFSLAALEIIAVSCGKDLFCPLLWILDNPSEPYNEADKNEGETTFDYPHEKLCDFLDRLGLKESVQRLQCGFYLQYNPSANPSQLVQVQSDMIELTRGDKGLHSNAPLLGLWSDASLDPAFDSVEKLGSWLEVVDAVNTDLPPHFWHRSES
jgi:hypothetical protein